jgi:phosphatidylserine decarboxylase
MASYEEQKTLVTLKNTISRIVPLDRSAAAPVIVLLLTSAFCFLFGVFVVGGILLTLAEAFLFFFRDPHREAHGPDGAIVSPADETVVEIKQQPMPTVGAPSIRLAIFLSIFNVHVNRAPCSGLVAEVHYQPGGHADARLPSSTKNESNLIVMHDGNKHVTVRQIAGRIAGRIARRVVCRVQPGQVVECGQRIGIIKFGSRVEICVPADSKIEARVGDRVWGGRSVLASLSSP